MFRRNTRTQILSYLSNLRELQETYHNHKETLGWAGVAVYIAGLIQTQTNVPQKLCLGFRLLIAGGVFVATLLFLAYTRRQFNNREWSARMYWALTALTAEALSGKWDHLPKAELAPLPPIQPEPEPSGWQKVLRLLLLPFGLVFPDRLPYSHNQDIYPAFVIAKIEVAPKSAGPTLLETLPYLMMAVGFLAAEGATFLRP